MKKLRRAVFRWFQFILFGRVLQTLLSLRYDAFVTKMLASLPGGSTSGLI